MAETKFEEYSSGRTNNATIYSNYWNAQTFTPSTSHYITKVLIVLEKYGSPTGTVTVGIYATSAGKPTGAALTTDTMAAASLSASKQQETFTFDTPVLLTASTMYAIVISMDTGDSSNKVYVYGNPTSGYASGTQCNSDDSGSSWNINTTDADFEDWGVYTVTDAVPEPLNYSKALVTVCRDEVWYESSAGTLEELTDANGDIDPTLMLSIWENYGKVFMVNETTMKVADFVNVKISTADINPDPGNQAAPIKGTILTDGSTGAQMVVDYITATDGIASVYGFRITSATFGANTITGTNATGTPAAVSFTSSGVETAPPHWYSYSVYGGDNNTYGYLPTKATLGCRYRGRNVLSGDLNVPHQWYMSRQGDPWDFEYTTNDAQSPVAGGNSDAGLVGDIITALIPWGDDFLIFGCANSIWLLRGDPAEHGTLDQITNIIGIFGKNSWCFDTDNNLYFLSWDGIYKSNITAEGMSKPVNISNIALPNLINDWALNRSEHHVVMTYDPIRMGVIISRTTLSDGTNLNYWYDLKTQGWFPETYPTESAIYSSFFYQAEDDANRQLILGTKAGYLSYFKDSAKDDDAGDLAEAAISSYMTLPIIPIGSDEDNEGKLTSLTFVTGGDGDNDTDAVSFEVHSGDAAETALEAVRDGDTAKLSGTITGAGRANRVRNRVRGRYLALKLYNSTATQTWAIERVSADIRPASM